MNDCSNHHSCSIRLTMSRLCKAPRRSCISATLWILEKQYPCAIPTTIRQYETPGESALSFRREECERRLAESRKGLLRHSIEMENRVSTFVSSTFIAFVIRTGKGKEKEETVGDRRRQGSTLGVSLSRKWESRRETIGRRDAKRSWRSRRRRLRRSSIVPSGNEPSRVTIRHARVCTIPGIAVCTSRSLFSPTRCRYHRCISCTRIYSNFYGSVGSTWCVFTFSMMSKYHISYFLFHSESFILYTVFVLDLEIISRLAKLKHCHYLYYKLFKL